MNENNADSSPGTWARTWERQLGDPRQKGAVLTFADALDTDEREAFPGEALDALRRLGLFAELVPVTDGGRMDEPERVLQLCRILSRRDLTVAVAFGQCLLGSLPIWLGGTAAQRAQHAESMLRGELACLALTEARHGSDLMATDVTAQRIGMDSYSVSGEKWLINNGSRGASATVLVQRRDSDQEPDLALMYLRRPQSGSATWLSIDKIHTHGIRGADISGFRLNGHVCGAQAMLGGNEPAASVLFKTLQISRILCAGFSLGATDTLARLTLGFTNQRMLYGKPVTAIPSAQAKLAQCIARLLMADVTALVATRAIAALPRELSLVSAICKYQVPTACESISRELAVVLGARHYIRSRDELGMFQKLMRDLQVVSLFDGSTQVNLALISSQLRMLSSGLRAAWQGRHEAAQGGEAEDACLKALVHRLLSPEAAVKGWPESGLMQLNARGRDSVAAAYIGMRRRWMAQHAPYASPEMDHLLSCIDASLSSWLDEAEHAAQAERLAPDSCRMIALAQRYAALWPVCLAALAWWTRLDAGRSADAALMADIMLADAQASHPEWQIPLAESRHQRLLDHALTCIAGKRMFSFNDLEGAW